MISLNKNLFKEELINDINRHFFYTRRAATNQLSRFSGNSGYICFRKSDRLIG